MMTDSELELDRKLRAIIRQDRHRGTGLKTMYRYAVQKGLLPGRPARKQLALGRAMQAPGGRKP